MDIMDGINDNNDVIDVIHGIINIIVYQNIMNGNNDYVNHNHNDIDQQQCDGQQSNSNELMDIDFKPIINAQNDGHNESNSNGLMDINIIDHKNTSINHNNIVDIKPIDNHNNPCNNSCNYLMNQILTEVNTNLFDFVSDLNGKQVMQTSLIEDILQSVVHIRRKVDKMKENDSKRKTIDLMKRREKAMNQKLEFMRKQCHELRDELEWSNECQALIESENKLLATNRVSNHNDLNLTICDLLYKITFNEKMLDYVISNSSTEFAAFIAKLIQILSLFVRSLENQSYDNNNCDIIIKLFKIMDNLLLSSEGRTYFLSYQNAKLYIELIYLIIKHTKNDLPLDLTKLCLSSIYNLCLEKLGLELVLELDGLISVLLTKLRAVPYDCVDGDVIFIGRAAIKTISLINHLLDANDSLHKDKKLKIKAEIKSLISKAYLDMIISKSQDEKIRVEAARLMLTVISVAKPEP